MIFGSLSESLRGRKTIAETDSLNIRTVAISFVSSGGEADEVGNASLRGIGGANGPTQARTRTAETPAGQLSRASVSYEAEQDWQRAEQHPIEANIFRHALRLSCYRRVNKHATL